MLTFVAVMPYFPYSRQSKKKSHRGAITARMIANLLHVAGVNHVITIDLHASQMQGFFRCPIDNLVAEPLLARWIKHNVSDWKEGVVVSKNPGGTKRVTSLADAMKLNFGIVTTERRRPHQSTDFSGNESFVFERLEGDHGSDEEDIPPEGDAPQELPGQAEKTIPERQTESPRPSVQRRRTTSNAHRAKRHTTNSEMPSSPLANSALPGNSPQNSPSLDQLMRTSTAPLSSPNFENGHSEEFTDEVRLFVFGEI
jgi:ribose-phosphate pyrophosphokinase